MPWIIITAEMAFMSHILGIDVGGTKIAAGLVDRNFKLTQIRLLTTSQVDLVGQVVELVAMYKGFNAISMTLPGRVFPSGLVYRLPNIRNFKPTNFKLLLQKRCKVPVTVVNDAKAFAFAEASIGQGRGSNSVAGVILGTGIGVGIVLNSKVYYGRNYMAGEMGHFLMPDGKVFEQFVKTAGKFKNAKQASKYLRMLLTFIILSFDPEIIVFGGGWSNLPGMGKQLNEILKTISSAPVKTKIRISKLKHGGLLGAALMALKK